MNRAAIEELFAFTDYCWREYERDGELATPREMTIDGASLWYSPADIFVHAFLHERQHHGDLNTLLYQLGIEVPIVEFRFSLPERRP